jgi:hypothetical protein
MKLVITVCATASYTYAMTAQARRVASAIRTARIEGGEVVIVGDTSSALKGVAASWTQILPEGWRIHLLADSSFVEGGENYKQQAQLLIAAMRTAAHTAARKLGATHCWSLDSDTLPQTNALRCLLDTVAFDNGFYDVAMCPYPNTAFLGGRGTKQNPIAEDWLPEERALPAWLAKVHARSLTWTSATKNAAARSRRLNARIRQCAPLGNVFAANSKAWRRRGWLESAYPGIGHGSIVPTDWVGFGCTMMTARALELAHFEGYDGGGTEDLFIGWHRWHPAGIRQAVLPHCPADHVIWAKKKNGDAKTYTLHHVYHEQSGECIGHLRVRETPWSCETHMAA